MGVADALAEERLRGDQHARGLRASVERLEFDDHQQDHHPNDRRHQQLVDQRERPTGSLYFAAGYFQNANDTSANVRLPPNNQNVKDTTSARNALDALTAEACRNAKAVNIAIYTIGFSVPSDPIDAAGQTLLRNCATNPGQFYLANTSDDLIKAFKQIQASIGALRLTQ